MSLPDFDLENPTEEHKLLREMVRDFTKDVIEPQAEQHDQSGELNVELMRRCGELGLLGITVPSEWGGAGMDCLGAVIVHHEFSKSDPGFALAYLAHSMLFVNNFFFASNDEQKKRYLPKVLSGEWIGAMGMTEPSSGTDVLGMRSTARKDGDHYVLKGRKALITNAPEADVFIIYAMVEGKVTSFVVERTFDGFSSDDKTSKMGMRSSTMGELQMDECRVPASNVLGIEGGGLRNMMRNLEVERLTLSAISLGIADRCMEVMLSYSAERETFGKKIAEHGQIQRYIGESYAKTEAMRSLVYNVSRKVRHDARNRLGTDASKLFAGPAAKEVADAAMQVLGGWGYCTEYQVERFLRDAKLIEIGGGTLESHQKNITKELMQRFR